MAYSASKNLLALGHPGQAVTLCDLLTRQRIATFGGGGEQYRTFVGLSPDGRFLVFPDPTFKRLILHDLEERQETSWARSEQGRVAFAVFFPDSLHLALGLEDSIEIWDCRHAKRIKTVACDNAFDTAVDIASTGQ